MHNLDNNAHSVFLLHYHLIMVVKYRRKVIDDQIFARARHIFEYICPSYGIVLEEWNHDADHVHVHSHMTHHDCDDGARGYARGYAHGYDCDRNHSCMFHVYVHDNDSYISPPHIKHMNVCSYVHITTSL